MRFVQIFKELAISVQKMTVNNLCDFRRLESDEAERLEQKLRRQLDNLFQNLNSYSLHSNNLQKLYLTYSEKCQALDLMLIKYD